MARLLIIVVVFGMLSAGPALSREPLTLDRIAELERGLDLATLESASPCHQSGDSPEPLGGYVRFYSEDSWHDRPVIRGDYVLSGSFVRDEPGVRLGRGPAIVDGGCSVVVVLFDAESGAPLTATCNGVA